MIPKHDNMSSMSLLSFRTGLDFRGACGTGVWSAAGGAAIVSMIRLVPSSTAPT